jgi:PAS domain-containing protein
MRGKLVEFEGAPASVNLMTGITERKRAGNALQESERKYRSVIGNIQDISYRTDRNGNLLMAIPSGASLPGYDSVNEVLGTQIATFSFDPAERIIPPSLTYRDHGIRITPGMKIRYIVPMHNDTR